ncbi:MAG: butyrate kinase [Alistipes sp.]|nr:butyrate kinase [Alistipes sp.]
MTYNILTINPGSTSTKVALFRDMEQVKTLTLRHTAEEIARFASVSDQLEWRLEIILDALKGDGIKLEELNAVIGRGGLMRPIESGVYRVNEAMIADLSAPKRQHASNLGALIARKIADQAGVEAYIADPVVVDELQDMARVSGLKSMPRRSIFHALNQKAIARRYAKEEGEKYEDLNLIVVHMGGGISVSAHEKGRVIDTNNALDGDGPIAPERAGTLPAGDLVDLCFSGQYDKAEIKKMLAGKGGLVDHVNCNSVQELNEVRAANGDAEARFMLDAMSYTIAKWVGEMAVVLKGRVDAILLTGGIAWNDCVNDIIIDYCKFIAPIKVYPGENELQSLAENALRVLRGETEAKEY